MTAARSPAIDLGSAALIVTGDLNSGLGAAVSSSDVDGDGSPELLLGAPLESGRVGAVHVVPATSRGEHLVGDVETTLLEGGDVNGSYGNPVAGLRADAGGYGGVAVGALAPNGAEDVWIFEGPLAPGTVGQALADAVIAIPGDGNRCAVGIASGDLDQDGALDHVLGCPGRASERAHLVLGPVSGTVEASNGVLTAVSEGDAFGVSIASIGDTDGDGADDVAIGAQSYDSGAGAAFVVLGSDFVGADSDVATVASGVLYGVDGELAGTAIAAGDVNGDGYRDLFVTAPTAEIGGASSVGRVYGVLGPVDEAAMSSPALRFDGEDREDLFGISVAANGDVNGDGMDDVLVGAEQEDAGVAIPGVTGGAYLFYGPMFERNARRHRGSRSSGRGDEQQRRGV